MGERRGRAAVMTGPRQIEFLDVPLDEPGPGEVLVETVASGISHGTEMNVYRGVAPQWSKRFDPALRLFVPVETTAQERPARPARGYWTAGDSHWDYPLAYGYANVGRVAAVGSDVSALMPGDLVYAYQPHQTAYVTPAAAVISLPGLADPAAGVLFSNLVTAYNGVLDADIRIGDTVVVFGQGIVGLLVTHLLQRTAAGRVIAVEGMPHRRDLALAFGAEEVLDPAAADVALMMRERTGGRGADVTIEASGSYVALQEAIRTAAPNTTVVALSWYGGTGEQLRLSDEFHHNRITIKSSQVGGIDPALSATHSLDRRRVHALDLLGALEAGPLISDRLPFSRAAEAYALVDQPGPLTTQVMLTY